MGKAKTTNKGNTQALLGLGSCQWRDWCKGKYLNCMLCCFAAETLLKFVPQSFLTSHKIQFRRMHLKLNGRNCLKSNFYFWSGNQNESWTENSRRGKLKWLLRSFTLLITCGLLKPEWKFHVSFKKPIYSVRGNHSLNYSTITISIVRFVQFIYGHLTINVLILRFSF